jgi:hypothetical protein
MKKEIRTVDEKRGVVQITTVDERYYALPSNDPKTFLPVYKFVPSVTYITSFYPKGKFFEEWLRKNGQESEIIKQLAAERGSKIHQACNDLIKGNEVAMFSKFVNTTTGTEEELTADEYEAVFSFANWVKDIKPKFVDAEYIAWGDGYAGTIDLRCEINKETYIVDFKTSQYIWPSMELQLSAYKHTEWFPEMAKLAILQLGYKKNKAGYKFTEIEDKYDLFLNVKAIFENETQGEKPKQIELPLSIKL